MTNNVLISVIPKGTGSRTRWSDTPGSWHDAITSYLFTLVSDGELVGALTLQTFLKSRRPIPGWQPHPHEKKLRLYRIATRLLTDELHTRARVYGAGSTVLLAREALESMPDRLRLPLLLFAEEGYTFKQIARHLHISASTAQARVSLARSWLQERYFIPEPDLHNVLS